MEELDSKLFHIPELIDYRASFDGRLRLEARVLDAGSEAQLCSTAGELYPELQIEVHASACQPFERPMYPGKRHIVSE